MREMPPHTAADTHAVASDALVPTTDAADLREISTRERFRGLLWLVAAAFFMQALDSTVVNTAVPAMAEALLVTPLGMRTALTSYVLTLAILIPASPWLCDRFGTRRVFGAAIVVFGLGSL
ncbi:MFS transporter, partial [Rhodanobacter denitrificans]|nr:MFS transporter [Rhodanobacter denitrificans]